MLFFRDRANVFFSLLAVFIIVGLYVLFLGNMMEQDLRERLGFESDRLGVAMSGLMLAGMVAVTSVTSSMGALGISVADSRGAARDFFTCPVSKGKVVFGYILGSGAVGFIMTIFALALSLAYICANGASLPGPTDLALLILTCVLSVLCGNAIVYFVSVFIGSQNAFSALSTVVGTLIGFLMGIYIPIGSLPDSVQWVIKCFPMSHAASMFRQIMADRELSALFANAPAGALDGMRKTFGVVFDYGGFESGFWFSAVALAVTAAAFYAMSLIAQKSHV
jgi:multidrug/hemolysin transport system permease protein